MNCLKKKMVHGTNLIPTQLHTTQQMTTKIAPAYDGKTSFFAFEDAIDDWCDGVTSLNSSLRSGGQPSATG